MIKGLGEKISECRPERPRENEGQPKEKDAGNPGGKVKPSDHDENSGDEKSAG